MDVCVPLFYVCVVLYVAALRQADPPSKESYRLCIVLKKAAKVQKRTVGSKSEKERAGGKEEGNIQIDLSIILYIMKTY
jgi:hypothetical protein